jgi:hypothetical protein
MSDRCDSSSLRVRSIALEFPRDTDLFDPRSPLDDHHVMQLPLLVKITRIRSVEPIPPRDTAVAVLSSDVPPTPRYHPLPYHCFGIFPGLWRYNSVTNLYHSNVMAELVYIWRFSYVPRQYDMWYRKVV